MGQRPYEGHSPPQLTQQSARQSLASHPAAEPHQQTFEAKLLSLEPHSEIMIYRVILSPDAKASIRSALHWYFQHDENAPTPAPIKAHLPFAALPSINSM